VKGEDLGGREAIAGGEFGELVIDGRRRGSGSVLSICLPGKQEHQE